MMASSWRYAWMIGLIVASSACDDDGDEPRVVAEDPNTGSSASAGSGASPGSGAKAGAGGAVDADAAQLALGELASTVDATVTGFSARPAGDPSATAGGVQGVIDVACLGGGAARVEGRVDVEPAPLMVDVDVRIEYAACASADRTGSRIDGSLRFTQTVVAGPGAPLRVATRYQGDVSFVGGLQLRCPIDADVLVDESGLAVEVTGEVCGRDAAGLSLQIAPHWQVQ